MDELYKIYQIAAIRCAEKPTVENIKAKLEAYRDFCEEFLK